MLTQEKIRTIRRRLHDAQHGSTQDKVLARQNYAEDVGTLLTLFDESAVGVAAEEISRLTRRNAELKAQLDGYARAEEREIAPPIPRRQRPLFVHDGKLAACGKDP